MLPVLLHSRPLRDLRDLLLGVFRGYCDYALPDRPTPRLIVLRVQQGEAEAARLGLPQPVKQKRPALDFWSKVML